jgi:hypothetical protein
VVDRDAHRPSAEFSLDVEEVELTGDTWAFERGGYTDLRS